MLPKRRYQVSAASVHDSQKLEALLDPHNTRKTVWADSAYRSQESDALLKKRAIQNRIHYRVWQNGELAPWQQQTNKRRSRIRARVEHVFGHQVKSMRMTVIRGIGLALAVVRIGLANLVYNMKTDWCNWNVASRRCRAAEVKFTERERRSNNERWGKKTDIPAISAPETNAKRARVV